jgi:hypothetical protein
LFLCQDIDGKPYLEADYKLRCYDERWQFYVLVDLVVIIVWVIGVPSFFAYLLHRIQATHSNRMPHIRYTLGFLFQQYTKKAWWFEIVDMLQRLIITSLLPFIPKFLPPWMLLPIGMIIILVHTSIIMIRQPYLLQGHEQLHLLSQVNVFMVLLAAYIIDSGGVVNTYGDEAFLSFFLILSVLLFVMYFAFHFLNACRMYILVARNKLRKVLVKRPTSLAIPGSAPGLNRGRSTSSTPEDHSPAGPPDTPQNKGTGGHTPNNKGTGQHTPNTPRSALAPVIPNGTTDSTANNNTAQPDNAPKPAQTMEMTPMLQEAKSDASPVLQPGKPRLSVHIPNI